MFDTKKKNLCLKMNLGKTRCLTNSMKVSPIYLKTNRFGKKFATYSTWVHWCIVQKGL